MQAAGFGVLGGHIALLLGVHEVQGGHGFHAQFGGVVAGEILGLVGAVEVVAAEARLTAGHVAANDEVGAAVVLADDHVLERLARTRHVHRVGQVGPADAGVVHLRGEPFVGLEAHLAGNVIVLGWATGGVHQHHAALAHVGGLEGAGEQFVVGAVDGIAALEGHHVLAAGQGGAHLGRRAAGKNTPGQFEALHTTAQIEAAPLGGDHAHGGVLEGGGAVAALGLLHLVGFPAALHREHGQVLALVSEQEPVAHGDAGVVGVEHDRQAEQQAAAGAVVGHHRLVVLLVHEAAQGREATHHQQFHIAGVAVAAGHHPIHPGAHRLPLVGWHHQVHQGASVGLDQTGRGDRHGRRGRQGQVILPDGGHWSGRPGLGRRRPAGCPRAVGTAMKKAPLREPDAGLEDRSLELLGCWAVSKRRAGSRIRPSRGGRRAHR